MRLRKNLKRATAAALALGMALSAASPAALAQVYDIADGSITITRKEDGKQEVKLNGEVVSDDDQDIIITGDNTVTTTSDDVQTENQQDDPDAAYSFSTMELTPEDYGEPDETEPTEEKTEEKTGETGDAAEATEDEKTGDATEESKEPERTVEETEQGTVITYDDYDVDPDVQVTRPAEKPRNAQKEAAENKDSKEDTITYDESNSRTTKPGTPGANSTVKIVNAIKDTIVKIILRNATINANYAYGGGSPIVVEGEGNVVIELDGDNTLVAAANRAGLEKQDSGNLTIEDSDKDGGKLTALGGSASAGIGGCSSSTGSNAKIGQNITINSGTIIAKGGDNGGAGIGGAAGGAGKDITINGGNVTAEAGYQSGNSFDGAGIGGGSSALGQNIKITDGTVKATGHSGGAGIGGGGYNTGTSDVTITGGNVTASSEDPWYDNVDGAGIGGGAMGSGKVTISGKDTVVNAKGSTLSAGIGGGYSGAGDVTISGGTVTAVGGSYTDPNSGAVAGGAGIGSGYGSTTESTIKISGGTVNATAGSNAPGIGGSSNTSNPTSEVIITGGKITAVADGGKAKNSNSAAIGGKNTTVSISNTDNDLEIHASIRSDHENYSPIFSRGTTVSSPITVVKQLFQFSEGHTALLQQFYKYDDATKTDELMPNESYHNTLYITQNNLMTHNKIPDADPDKNAHQWELVSTSTSGGTTTYNYKCALCNETKTATETTTPTHDHKWGDLIVDIPATCGKAGIGHRKCTETGCNETTPENIPATGNHTWGDWTDDPSDSTKEMRTCTVCGKTETRDKTVTPTPTPTPVPTPAPTPNEDNGGSESGTVSSITTGLKVLDPANRDVIGDARYVTLTQVSNVLYIDADEDTASLEGTLLDLAELKANDIDTVVFSTKHCTSTIYTAEMTAQGSDDTQFTLIHSGSTATLTVGGVQHNELIH